MPMIDACRRRSNIHKEKDSMMNHTTETNSSLGQETISPSYASGRRTGYRWVVMGLIFLIYAVACADRANFGIALPYMKKEYHISNTESGLIVSLFFFAYGIVQIPVGLIYKRLSGKTAGRLFALFMLLTSAFTGLMGTTSSVMLLQLYRVGLGLSEGPLGIGCTNVINRWFPASEKGTAVGIWLAASKLGPVIVPSTCLIIIELWGWREIFYFFAIPGILLSFLWLLLVTTSPNESRFCNDAERRYIAGDTSAAQANGHGQSGAQVTAIPWLDAVNRTRRVPRVQTLRQVFTSWNIWGVALGYGCVIGVANIFMTWIPTYLITVKGFASIKVGFLASAPFIGAVIGNMVGGMASDRLLGGRRKPMMILGAAGTAAMTLLLVAAPESSLYLGLSMLAAGLMMGVGYAGYSAYSMGLATQSTYPAAFGIVNSVGQLGGACAPLAVGVLLDSFNWTSVFLYMVATSVLCVALLLSVVEPLTVIQDKPPQA
jgi:sugar phosphate permease